MTTLEEIKAEIHATIEATNSEQNLQEVKAYLQQMGLASIPYATEDEEHQFRIGNGRRRRRTGA